MSRLILPCPFCGGEAELIRGKSMHGGYLFGIMCNVCASRGDLHDTESQAIDAWNSRAERTCYLDKCRKCSACGITVHEKASYGWIPFGDGISYVPYIGVKYCPQCGARILEDRSDEDD